MQQPTPLGPTIVLITFPISLALTWLMIHLAQRYRWVARPKADRWHQRPTALYGGVAIVVAFLIGCLAFLANSGIKGIPALNGLLIDGVILFAVGLRDDIRPLNPLVKLVGQVMAIMPFLAGVMIAYPTPLAAVSLPFLLFWMLALTNAFNLLDNMDGLSTGIAVVVGGVLSIYFTLNGLTVFAVLSALMVAACLGFFWFNFRAHGSAHIFMGDCGSMFLGYMLSGLTALGVCPSASTPVAAALLPLLLMAVPLFDTTLVIIRRRREGRAISQGGKDHSSHRLVYAGFSDKQAVLLLHGVCLLFGTLGVLLDLFYSPIFAACLVALGGSSFVAFGNFLSAFTGPGRAAVATPVLDKHLDATPSS